MSSKQHSPSLAAMTPGVVYGDIGTSPLYTLHEIFLPVSGLEFCSVRSCVAYREMRALTLQNSRPDTGTGTVTGHWHSDWFAPIVNPKLPGGEAFGGLMQAVEMAYYRARDFV